MTNMAIQGNYHRLIGYMLMQRLYAYLLVLRYIQLMNKVSKPNGTVISFKYNPFGRRIEKRIVPSPLAGEGAGEGVTKTFTYFYDNEDILIEYDANGIVGNRYIHGTGIDEPLARIKSDDSVRYYQQDALGSVVALTDEAGTIKTQYVYDPYGNTEMIGEASDNPFQYTGREDDGTGLYYYHARYYSPELQRFISEDPIGLEGGINYYLYVGNNPVNFVDPLGLWEFIYSAGGHFPTGPWPISAGGTASSALVNPLSASGGLEYRGVTPEATAGVWGDFGVSAGIGDLSGTGNQAGPTIGIGSGRYGGIQITLRKDFDPNRAWYNPLKYIDTVSIGLGLGLGLPVNVTSPLNDNKPCAK